MAFDFLTEALDRISQAIRDNPPAGTDVSTPPQGLFKVTNLYVNAEGKLVVEYEDTPTP